MIIITKDTQFKYYNIPIVWESNLRITDEATTNKFLILIFYLFCIK